MPVSSSQLLADAAHLWGAYSPLRHPTSRFAVIYNTVCIRLPDLLLFTTLVALCSSRCAY